jgi:hypothetical protein
MRCYWTYRICVHSVRPLMGPSQGTERASFANVHYLTSSVVLSACYFSCTLGFSACREPSHDALSQNLMNIPHSPAALGLFARAVNRHSLRTGLHFLLSVLAFLELNPIRSCQEHHVPQAI